MLCDIVIATEDAYFQDAPHPAFGIVPGDGLHILWPEVIGEIRGRYFLLSGQKLTERTAAEPSPPRPRLVWSIRSGRRRRRNNPDGWSRQWGASERIPACVEVLAP